MATVKLSVPKKFRRGALRDDEAASLRSAFEIMKLVDAARPVAGARWLDFGCGVKMAQALCERDSPQALYAGLDVYTAMIDHMRKALAGDARYMFATVPFQNDMYNPKGDAMTPQSVLPLSGEPFDILTMFSVITHLAPHDTAAILEILRRYAAADGRLVFSCFVDAEQIKPFFDEVPDKPLLRARYRKSTMEDMIRAANWKIVEDVRAVPGVIQHRYVCAPA
ncbi:MAG: class I SAM-dependent methyltransferase [Alphaproteobacteria bacterium]|nr:class I SAM-dependent methyltransferase [Alphaproteobacteria bacterium]